VEEIAHVPESVVLNLTMLASATTWPAEPDPGPIPIVGSDAGRANVAVSAKSPFGLPVSVSVYVVANVAVGATVKVPAKFSKGPEIVGVIVGEPENSAPPGPVKVSTADVSEPLKPVPDTETLSPCPPVIGETVSVGAVMILKGDVAVPVAGAFAVTVTV
jgi:hypothetical protein